METEKKRKTSRKKMRKYSSEEKRAFFENFVPQNKTMKACVEHRGECWIKDPMLLL